MTRGSVLKHITLRFKGFIKYVFTSFILLVGFRIPLGLAQFVISRIWRIKLEPCVSKDHDDPIEVKVCKYKNDARGVLCISIDHEPPPPSRSVPLDTLSKAVTHLLSLSEQYKIPITWGILGDFGLKHPLLLKKIINSPIQHDIGAHSFSHVDFSKPLCTEKIAKKELSKCIEALKKTQRPVTFIFPWNREGHLNILRELGFITYRGGSPKLSCPFKKQDLWVIPQTYCLVEDTDKQIQAVLKLVDLAILYNCVLHLWSHPWNMHINNDAEKFAKRTLNPLLRYAVKKRQEKSLWICTMQELANYCEARENCTIDQIIKNENEIRLRVTYSINDPRFNFPPEITLKIPIPKENKKVTILIDGKTRPKEEDWHLKKEGNIKFLVMTLSFENQTKKIQIIMENKDVKS